MDLVCFEHIDVKRYLTSFAVFPTAQYTLPKLFIIPTAYYIAIALTTLVFVFPESLNHVWL